MDCTKKVEQYADKTKEFYEPGPLTRERLIQEFRHVASKRRSLGMDTPLIGMEHEVFLLHKPDGFRIPYDTQDRSISSIKLLLESLHEQLNASPFPSPWEMIYERGNLIGLKRTAQNGTPWPHQTHVCLEPVGQLEFSSTPLKTLHALSAEYSDYHKKLDACCEELGIVALSQGIDPRTPASDAPWIPRQDYEITRSLMKRTSTHGQEMMSRTCTVQASLDYTSEQDMGEKFRIGTCLQPIITDLFSTSPYSFLTTDPKGACIRSLFWARTDPDRCGLPEFGYKPLPSFADVVDYALDVPMLFYQAGDKLVDLTTFSSQKHRKITFREALDKPDLSPHLKLHDWLLHLTLFFPDVRLKSIIEMRGADAGDATHSLALPALWVGLLYDRENQKLLFEKLKHWTKEQGKQMLQEAGEKGLQSQVSFDGKRLVEHANDLIDLSIEGLRRRQNLRPSDGQDESIYLEPFKISLLN